MVYGIVGVVFLMIAGVFGYIVWDSVTRITEGEVVGKHYRAPYYTYTTSCNKSCVTTPVYHPACYEITLVPDNGTPSTNTRASDKRCIGSGNWESVEIGQHWSEN